MERDFVSNMPFLHMSFILRHFLPMAFPSRTRELREILQKTVEAHFKVNIAVALATGSSVEGLGLPRLFRLSRGQVVDSLYSDIDIMMIGMLKFVGDQDLSPKTDLAYYIYTEGVHPGYLWLQIVHPESTSPSLRSQVSEQSCYFLDAEACTKVVFDGIDVDIGDTMTLQGPAVTFNVANLTSGNTRHIPLGGEADSVHGLKVPVWPKMAQEWAARRRTAGWPTQELVDDIVAHGCHVVAAGHAKSVHHNLEWRFSFSQAELVLAGNLTQTQKQCYLLLKTLHLAEFKQPKGVVSYHLKMLLFWTCEQIPQRMWTEETVGQCVVSMLDRLLHCLVCRNLPSYFIPANNLIDSIPDEVLNVVIKKVRNVRRDPVRSLLRFNLNYKYFFGPIYSDVYTIFQPVLDDAETASTLKDSFFVLVKVTKNLARSYIIDHIQLWRLANTGLRQSDNEEYTLPYEHTIAVYEDVSRMARNIIHHETHPARLIMPLVEEIGIPAIATVLCKVLLAQYPNAPNREEITAKLDSLEECMKPEPSEI